MIQEEQRDAISAKKKFANIDETAEFLGVPRSWLYDRTRRNAIPMRRIGKYVRFDLDEIDGWSKAGCPPDWKGVAGK